MRTLFTKILVWFLLTVIVTFTGTFYVSSMFVRSRQPEFSRFTFELREARAAWETDGSAGLTRFLNRLKEATGADAGLAYYANGRDVLTGRDWTKEIKSPSRGARGALPFMGLFGIRIESPRSFTTVTPSKDKRFYFVAIYPARDPNQGWSVQVPSQTWWMLVIFAILCYGLARQLTSPLRKMQKTVERFGRGDFTARVNSRRADELGQLGRTVDQMAERIESLLKSQRRLLQDISHELRSPLARLNVAVDLARGADPESALSRIQREADRLNVLVGELIQVTRAEGDPAGLSLEPVRLDELVRVIMDDVHIEAERHLVGLDLDVCEAEMQGNPELLRRAFENIVRNAIRYSPEGSHVQVTLKRTGSTYRLAVRDFGSGVPDESLAQIFDPFYRVEKDRGRTSGGVGLGLAIARRAIELHHGIIHASNQHPGLLVEIELPAPAEVKAEEPVLTTSES